MQMSGNEDKPCEILTKEPTMETECEGANKPIIYLTRIEHFCAAHRLYNCELSDTQNEHIFGKCTNTHGHNYRLEVTVKGSVDRTTGMVMNITHLKRIIKLAVLDQLDHRMIDTDVHYFRDQHIPSTSENIAIFAWKQIERELCQCMPSSSDVHLHRIRLHETDKNVVEYFG